MDRETKTAFLNNLKANLLGKFPHLFTQWGLPENTKGARIVHAETDIKFSLDCGNLLQVYQD